MIQLTKSIIRYEIAIIKLEKIAVENLTESNGAATISRLIEIRLKSSFAPVINWKAYIEWITNQVFENKLPENSSGSFFTAMTDIDNFISGLSLEDESEELYNFATELFKKEIY